jgi:LPS export ABC transporter protein LptC/lipopolysaccharide transport protein LptA
MAITMDGRDTPWSTGSRGRPQAIARERAFRRARRHTRLVKVLRVAMPIGAVLLSGYYALTLGVSWQLGAGRLKVDEVRLTPDDLTMKNPKYFGLTKDGGSYEVRAQKAILEFNKDAPIKLIGIDGDLRQPNNVVTNLRAKRGTLDNAKSELELYDGIEIDASSGMKARLSRAKVFSKEHKVVSKEPVDLTMPTGSVQGATLTLRTDTREATFVGAVRAHLAPAAREGRPRPDNRAFGRDSSAPVDVTSEQLYVNDTNKTALFMGKVVAQQGDATLKAAELHIGYEGAAAADLAGAAQREPGEAARLSRLVAKEGAVLTMGADRRIASDEAQFDAKAETALFVGNVLVNQQRNVLQGKRLFIDRKTGKSRLEAPGEGDQPAGRIAATFYQGDAKAAAQAKPKRASAPVAQALQDGMLGTFKTDPNAPMDIEADTLDVDDSEKRAVFHGNVKSQQGDVIIRTVELVAFYSGQAGLGLSGGGEEAAGRAPSQLTRVEAKQRVLLTSKDGQSASGDWATFDTKSNTVLIGGNVTVSRGKDVVQGSRLKIDLTSGMYRFEQEEQPAAVAAPTTSASPPLTGASDPAGRACPPGKQCLLLYPKEALDKAKEEAAKRLPGAANKTGEGWLPSTSASPAMRSE